MTAGDAITTTAEVTANIDVNLSSEGIITTGAAVTAKTGNVIATAHDAVTINADVSAKQNVMLTSESEGISQAEETGIQAQTVTATSAKDVDLQGEYNQFSAITVQSSDKDIPIQGSVSVLDSTEELKLSVLSVVDGDIAVENTQETGALQVVSGLQAKGDGADAKGDITLKSNGNMQTDGTITAANDVLLTSTDGAITTNNTVTAENGNIAATAKGNVTTNKKLSAAQGEIALTSDAGSVAVKDEATAKNNVELSAEAGSVAIDGAVTSKEENVIATAKNAVTINADVNAKQNVMLTSESAGITQAATTGIKAQTVTTASALGVDLQGTGNQFGAITVQSSDDADIEGSVLVNNSADKLVLSVQPVVNGDIKVENSKPEGMLQVSSDLQAKGDGAGAKGDIALKSDGSMQTDKKLTAANNVALTSTTGDVSIHGDVSTGTKMAVWNEEKTELEGTYNSLVIQAGGAIREDEDVNITTPVVETSSGKGVYMESEKNNFAVFTADALEEETEINGSVKVVSNYAGNGNDALLIGVGASVRGDAEFTNLDSDGGLDILILHPTNENKEIKVLGGNGAEGNLVLQANKDVNLLGDANAAHDVVIDSTDGSFSGIGRGIKAGNDVSVSVGEGVYYIGGTLKAGNNILIEALQPDSQEAGIYIGALPKGMQSEGSAATGATLLTAGNEARFDVQGDGNIALEGSITAGKVAEGGTTTGGDVVANIDGEGSVLITGSVESKNGDVSVQTGEGHIYIGTDKTPDEETIKAKNNVTVGTDLGTIYIQGETSTTTGDITMTARKDTYEQGTGAGNFIIRDDGKLNSGGGVVLNGRNGDIEITEDIQAAKGITVNIAEQGNASFGRDVSVTNDVNISTDKGTITVGHTVNSDEGNVSLKSENGDILVGQDVTAGQAVSITSQQGSVVVGDATTGNDGDILAENGDVSIQAGQDVVIVKTITAQGQEGDIDIASGQGDIIVGNTVNSDEGNVSLQSGNGDILVGQDITAGQAVSITSQQGDVVIGDVTTDEGDILAKNGDVSIQTGQGTVAIVKTVTAQKGSIDVESGKGDILIGDNGADVKTVSAEQNVKLATQDGTIVVSGKTETRKGDITVLARDEDNNNNLIINGINLNGELYAGAEKNENPNATGVTGNLTLQTYNGDIKITDHTKAKGNINAKVENKGSIGFDVDVNTDGDLNFEVDEGDIKVDKTVTATGDISMATGTGIITVGSAVTSKEGSIDIQVGTGGVTIGNNGKDVETVTAKNNIDIGVELGQVKIYGKTSTKEGDISMAAGENQYTPGTKNFIIEQNGLLESGRDINLTGRNGDLYVTDAIQANRNLNAQVNVEGGVIFDESATLTGDVTVQTETGPISIAGQVNANLVDLVTGQGDVSLGKDVSSNTSVNVSVGTGNVTTENVTAKNNVNVTVQNGNIQMHDVTAEGTTTITNTGRGNINGNNIISGGTTHVSLTDGDLFLNLAEGKAVVLRMENNTAASRVNTVKADASGGAGLDVELTGNFIQIGTIEAKGGNSVLQLSAIGAGNQKLISGEISVGSLRSSNGTHMPSLWANRGNVHVDEGNLAIDDVLAKDKIHLENNLTDLAIFGRTPTRDGEQLYYWNNLGRAYSKTRPFALYTDGKVRTHRAVLVDAGRYYDKLYGDNLSVVDMMRERLTHLHGQFTFDSTLLTKRGEFLREKVLFGMDAVDTDIRKHNASNRELL